MSLIKQSTTFETIPINPIISKIPIREEFKQPESEYRDYEICCCWLFVIKLKLKKKKFINYCSKCLAWY